MILLDFLGPPRTPDEIRRRRAMNSASRNFPDPTQYDLLEHPGVVTTFPESTLPARRSKTPRVR